MYVYIYIYRGKYPNIDYRIEINLGFGASSRIEKKKVYPDFPRRSRD